MFVQPRHRVDLRDQYTWWNYVLGADWRHPRGLGGTIRAGVETPVVHVAWEDVETFAGWAGKEIPTEARSRVNR